MSIQATGDETSPAKVPSSSAELPDWLLTVWKKTGGKSWEPPQPDSKGVLWLIENGFAKRVDGRCGFEAFKDSMLAWTTAGAALMVLIAANATQPKEP